MKTKQLINLVLILGILCGLVVFKQMQKPKELTTQEYTPLDISFETGKVASLTLANPKTRSVAAVEVVKEGEAWKLKSLSGARVDAQKVNDFLKEIQEAQGEMRGNDVNLLKDFGISDEESFEIILKSEEGKGLLHLRVGSKKPDYRSTFIRRNDSNAVYLTPADILGKLGVFGDPKTETIQNSFWASSEIAELDPDKVTEIKTVQFMDGKEHVRAHVIKQTLASDTNRKEWKYVREGLPFGLDANKIRTFLTSIKTWKATKVLDAGKDKESEYGLDKPDWQMSVKLESGEEVNFKAATIDKDQSKQTYLSVSTSPVLFQYSTYYYENLNADDSRFFVDNPLGVDANKIEKLVVQSGDKRWEVSPKQKTWDSLSKYLEDLKTLKPTRLLFDKEDVKKAKSKGYSIEIIKEGGSGPLIFQMGEVVKDTPKEYAASVAARETAFAVSEFMFKKLFDEASRLDAPKEETKAENQTPITSSPASEAGKP